MTDARRLMTLKSDLGTTVIDAVADAGPLQDGEVILALDRFSLTTNNITYAAFGDAIGYWKVFPTGRDDQGLMPVWGFADVRESRAEGIEVGARVFGYFPIADTLRVQAGKVSRGGFADLSPWRMAVPDIYNRYVLCAAEANYSAALEPAEAIFRPLFVTSYTAVEFLRDNGFFGATRVLISSASSKTAYGSAWALLGDDVEVLAVTGSRNRAFVERVEAYAAVFDYDQIEHLPTGVPTVYLDLSGDPGLRARIHDHLGADLTYDCLVGATQTDGFTIDKALPGPPPVFFFAATVLDQHRERGTLRGFYERFFAEQRAFYERVVDAERPWIHISESYGFDAAAAVILGLADGRSDPAVGHVIRLRQ
ncbi:MAG: DUF2855 family protein [Brevundimonas sp.]|nr:MAG: DUF2855 family protein [Brevundimonas sp.]